MRSKKSLFFSPSKEGKGMGGLKNQVFRKKLKKKSSMFSRGK